jgi:replicative DNA helicase
MLLPLDNGPVPSATEQEARLLSCLALDSLNEQASGCFTKALALGISDESFFKPTHKLVWQAFNALRTQGYLLDELGAHCWLRDNTEEGMTIQELSSILDTCETTTWFDHWLQVVLEAQAKREYRARGLRIAEMASEGASISDMGAAMENRPKAVLGGTQSVDKHAMAKEVTRRLLEAKNSENHFLGLPTGIGDWDFLLGGLRPATLNVVAARPGIGKTTIALQTAINLVSANHRCRFWSLEMTPEQVLFKLALNLSETCWQDVKEGWLPQEQQAKFEAAANAIGNMPLDIAKESTVTTQMIAGALHQDIAMNPPSSKPELVIIDYLQLITPMDRRLPREEQVAAISRDLKLLANDTGIPIMILAQLNRDSVKEKRRPKVSDLRGSGAIEQDADTITLLHYTEDMPSTELILIVDKNREDQTGSRTVTFNKRLSRIYDTPYQTPQ